MRNPLNDPIDIESHDEPGKNDTLRIAGAVGGALAIAAIYAVVTVALFNSIGENDFLNTMTCGFLFLVPIAMGGLTVYWSPDERRRSKTYAIFMPWASVALTMLVISAFEMEAVICIIMALPLFLTLASLGGYLFRSKDGLAAAKGEVSALGFILLAPYVVTPLELQTPNPDSIYTVQNQIVIQADVDTVWQQIIEVPMIGPNEQRFSVFHLLGLPKPLEATLSHEGVGGVRHASFENNLIFIEKITAWTDHESLSFTIDRDKQMLLEGPLNEIGGEYFDIIDGTYRIETVDNKTVILYLSSTHRLSTRFDFYGNLWTRWVMWDLQQYILDVIKERCEV